MIFSIFHDHFPIFHDFLINFLTFSVLKFPKINFLTFQDPGNPVAWFPRAILEDVPCLQLELNGETAYALPSLG